MNATALAQSEFDNRLPPPVSESPLELARAEWLYNAVEQLVRFGCDVKVQRRLRRPQAVTVAQLALAAEEHDTMQSAGVAVRKPHVPVVFGSCYSAQVGGLVVPAISIYVVDLHALWDRPVMQLPNEPVGSKLGCTHSYHLVAVAVRRASSLACVLSVPEIKHFGAVNLMRLPGLPVHGAVGWVVTEQTNNVGAAYAHLHL